MELTCPNCSKKVQKLEGLDPTSCKRCGCELEVLWKIRITADSLLAEGQSALQNKNYSIALQQAQKAWKLIHSQEAAKLAFFAALGLRDFDEAYFWYQDRCFNHP